MPKKKKIDDKLVYPPGVKDITEDVSTDDLVRRLKDCAVAFQNMNQDDDNSVYIPLALYLATENYLEHKSQDVRLLTACCIADVFRVYAPEAPYKDPYQLKLIFEFFVNQLRGLKHPKATSFKHYFYLLENLAWVKTFNICIELEENQKIICDLYALIFDVVRDSHSEKVKKFMLDMLSPLISEADTVSQELLDIILTQIIEPAKSQNKSACNLAQAVLKRTSVAIEPYIQNFFNSCLVFKNEEQTPLASRLYELIHEIYFLCPSMLVAVLPQLELKLKSDDDRERLQITQVLAQLFSAKDSNLASENKVLWKSFIGRFNDINSDLRVCIVQSSVEILLNHPNLEKEMTEQLKQRFHDHEECVRLEAVKTVITAARKDIFCVSHELLNCVKERSRDKRFKIRKEALLGLAVLYKENVDNVKLTSLTRECLLWVRNKVFHSYYLNSIEDRLLVERILHTCLVPYQCPIEERMRKVLQLVSAIDDYAFRAFKELLRFQNLMRLQFKCLVEMAQKCSLTIQEIQEKVSCLAKHLQDPVKSQEFILKFLHDIEENVKLKNMLLQVLNGNSSCSETEGYLKGILKTLGMPVQTNLYYMTVKQLLERVAPVMFDKTAITLLVKFFKNSAFGNDVFEGKTLLLDKPERGLDLLHFLSSILPKSFHQEIVCNDLIAFFQAEDDIFSNFSLKIFSNVCSGIETKFPEIAEKLIPLLEDFTETGTVKQAKHAIYCLNTIMSDKEAGFGHLIERLKKHFTLESQYFRTALVSIGHISFLCHDQFSTQLKSIVSNVVVRDLLMRDQDFPRGGESDWGPLESLPEETKVKIAGMKLMVRWLMGLKSMVQPAVSTFRLLHTVILNGGDLMERQYTSPNENSWLRLTASACIVKLCQEPNYVDALTVEQFQCLTSVINDECLQVRDVFVQKLNKGLMRMKLPLEFMGMFCLCGIEENEELKDKAKNYLLANIKRRRDYLKEHPVTTDQSMLKYIPEYVLSYAIHLLAHSKFFSSHDNEYSLLQIKDCLWYIMEPLVKKNEYNSFIFLERLLSNVKGAKDKQSTDGTENLKLHAVCDVALSLLKSKVTNYKQESFMIEPVVPSKLYSPLPPSEKYADCPEGENSLEEADKVQNFEPAALRNKKSDEKEASSSSSCNLNSSVCDASLIEQTTLDSKKVEDSNTHSTRRGFLRKRSQGIEQKKSPQTRNCKSKDDDQPATENNSSFVDKDMTSAINDAESQPLNETKLRGRGAKKRKAVVGDECISGLTTNSHKNVPSKPVSVVQNTSNSSRKLIKKCNVILRKDDINSWRKRNLRKKLQPKLNSRAIRTRTRTSSSTVKDSSK